MARTPIARSPYPTAGRISVEGNWEVSTAPGGDLTITDLSRLAKWTVRAPADGRTAAGLPPRSRLDRVDGRLRIGGAPGEWLVIAGPETAAGVQPEPGEFVAVVDVTHGRALLRMTGDNGRELLAKICAVNLSDRACPNGAALRTGVGGIVTDLARDDVSGTLSFLLHCERSASRSLLEALLHAGKEFGVVFAGTGPAVP